MNTPTIIAAIILGGGAAWAVTALVDKMPENMLRISFVSFMLILLGWFVTSFAILLIK